MNTNRNNKSLLIISSNIHLGGGGERVACNIANHYYNKDWQVEIVSFNVKKDNPIFNLNSGIIRHYLNVKSKNKLIQKFVELVRLKKFLKRTSSHFVMAIGSHPNVILGFCSNKKGQSIRVGTEHSHYYNAPKLWNYLRKWSYPKLSAITVLTNNDYPILKSINSNTFVIPNALTQLPQIHISGEQHTFLAVGRLSQEKQFAQMINVFADFCKSNSEWNLIIIGDGGLREELKMLIESYNIGNRVNLKHFTNNIEKEYLSSSILLSTSKSEGLPMIEAQSYGLPIIAYNCKTGPADIVIDGQNGFLVEVDDKNTMLQKMLLLAEDKDLRSEMSRNAIKDAYRFSPETVYNKWDNLFNYLEK